MPAPAQTIKMYDALQRMRKLSEMGVPFSIGFVTCNLSTQSTKGYKVVPNAVLRAGYRDDQSHLANILVAYTDMSDETSRQFYLPLLLMFNGFKIEA
jgi:hypothetical protein